MDATLNPMIADTAKGLPHNDADWVLEPKFDGWRCVVLCNGTAAHVYGGRNGNEYSGKVPYLEDALREALPSDTAIDGELICASGFEGVGSILRRNGPHVPNAMDPALQYVVFDVTRINGSDVRSLEWTQRRGLLEMIQWPPNVYLSPTGEATEAAHLKMLDLGMEGSMLKHREGRYQSGIRSNVWQKLKAIASEDCTITGWQESDTQAGRVGALEVELASGATTTVGGLTDKMKADILANFDEKYRGKMVEVTHNGILKSGKLRHPRFGRMRDDRTTAPTPVATGTRRTPAGRRSTGPKMRNYSAMGKDKLLRCINELAIGSGDAYERVSQHAGTVGEHLAEAKRVAREQHGVIL
jgi:ATP-dependent DNA ligase